MRVLPAAGATAGRESMDASQMNLGFAMSLVTCEVGACSAAAQRRPALSTCWNRALSTVVPCASTMKRRFCPSTRIVYHGARTL